MQVDVKLPAGRGAYAVDPEGEEEAERKALLRRRHHQQARQFIPLFQAMLTTVTSCDKCCGTDTTSRRGR